MSMPRCFLGFCPRREALGVLQQELDYVQELSE